MTEAKTEDASASSVRPKRDGSMTLMEFWRTEEKEKKKRKLFKDPCVEGKPVTVVGQLAFHHGNLTFPASTSRRGMFLFLADIKMDGGNRWNAGLVHLA